MDIQLEEEKMLREARGEAKAKARLLKELIKEKIALETISRMLKMDIEEVKKISEHMC